VQNNPALVQAMAAHERDPTSSEAGLSELSAFFSIRGWHPSIRIRDDDLRAIQQPTLVIWGDHDPIGSPDDVRAGVQAIPDVRFETTPTGHGPFLTYPERCADLVRAFRSE
jgi:pimeloyl-ACP methyl ester carboxylesterase